MRYKRVVELTVRANGTADWRGRRLRCALGRSGISGDKREGDGATPSGVLIPLRVLYRPDRLPPPPTSLPTAALAADDGWCDDPDDAEYNRQVALPHGAGCEALWRDNRLYDLIAVTDFNADPVVPGRGSAIFVHLAKPGYAPTEGCIAFSLSDLRAVLRQWRQGDAIRVVAP